MAELFALVILLAVFGFVLLGLRHLLRAGYLLSVALRGAVSDPKNSGIDGDTLRTIQGQIKRGIDEPHTDSHTPDLPPTQSINIPKIGRPHTANPDMVQAVNELYGADWGVSFNGISREQGLLIINTTEIAWCALNMLEDDGVHLPHDDSVYVHKILATLFSTEKYHDDIMTMDTPADTESVKFAMDTVRKM